jgi:oxygen-independent coproporphyrinogen-3 oxidase
VPFCARRCDYCAFAAWDDRHELTGRYLAALARQAEAAAADCPPVTSVFVGGGTPSMVPAAALLAVLAELPLVEGAEVSVECNPDTVDAELVDTYVAGGVNRLSFGVQSMVPHVLAALGRTHDPANVARCAALARAAGLASWNVDVIYGAAGESLHDWRRTLTEVLALEPPHLSAYGLTVEPGTPLADDAARHPDDDDQADKYELADTLLTAGGLDWYEVSNWARAGHECRHNRLYWSQGEYLALGCAAHGHRHGRRHWNLRTPERYVEAVEAGLPVEAAGEVLGPDERRTEALQLALRTREGVPAEALPAAGLKGLVEHRGGRAVLTRAGRLLANEVAIRLR